MKKILITVLILTLAIGASACNPNDELPVQEQSDGQENKDDESEPQENMKLKITIGNNVLTATFADNATAKDFITLLPLTVELDDYASTEKIFYLSRKLSTIGTPSGIDPSVGDITYYAPWGNIAIFYKDFRFSNGLVKIAHIDSGIEALQISGKISNVKFELIENEE